MRLHRRTCLALLGFGLAGLVGAGAAQAAGPQAGRDYVDLRTPQPAAGGNKVEVTEFFAYYCPHCDAFEPVLAEWVKRQGDNIVFRRVHVERGPAVLPQQRLFYTLDAMGLLPRYHAKVFEAMHAGHQRLASDEEVIAWAARNGIDRAAFTEAYRSFGVEAKLRGVAPLMAAYDVDRWPLVAIDGRWLTSPSHAAQGLPDDSSQAAQLQAALAVMDVLVERARAARTAKAHP
jgi:thiol:disulfide interchange protein DsbA